MPVPPHSQRPQSQRPQPQPPDITQTSAYKVRVFFYRLIGKTETQAEFLARQALEERPDSGPGPEDRHFHCACGQLMVKGDTVCPACGRKQWLPFGLRRAMRKVGFRAPDSNMGTATGIFLALLGYMVQLRYGSGHIVNPTNGLESAVIGAWVSPRLANGLDHWWRWLSYTWMHGGLMHIGFNTVATLQVGPLVEGRFGTARFMAIWVVAGIAGAGGQLLWESTAGSPSVLVGASGSLFGLIGAAALEGHRVGTAEGRYIRNMMLQWAAITTVIGLVLPIAHSAHFGGMVAGAIVALVLRPVDNHRGRRALSPIIGLLAIGALAASFFAWAEWLFEVPALLEQLRRR
jgi:membrane associated rhomboid family serine protease